MGNQKKTHPTFQKGKQSCIGNFTNTQTRLPRFPKLNIPVASQMPESQPMSQCPTTVEPYQRLPGHSAWLVQYDTIIFLKGDGGGERCLTCCIKMYSATQQDAATKLNSTKTNIQHGLHIDWHKVSLFLVSRNVYQNFDECTPRPRNIHQYIIYHRSKGFQMVWICIERTCNRH